MLRNSLIALVTVLSLTVVPAFAQETGITGELERVAATTPQEKLDYSSDALEEMRESVRTVTKLLETARRDGAEADQIQCLTSRMTGLRALLQVSEAADTSMQSALAEGASAMADHEFRKIAVALSKTRQLAAEADRCLSDDATANGETIVRTEEPDYGSDETVEQPSFSFDLGFDPPEASPFM